MRELFTLTTKERWMVAGLIAALLVGAAVRYYRASNAPASQVVREQTK